MRWLVLSEATKCLANTFQRNTKSRICLETSHPRSELWSDRGICFEISHTRSELWSDRGSCFDTSQTRSELWLVCKNRAEPLTHTSHVFLDEVREISLTWSNKFDEGGMSLMYSSKRSPSATPAVRS